MIENSWVAKTQVNLKREAVITCPPGRPLELKVEELMLHEIKQRRADGYEVVPA